MREFGAYDVGRWQEAKGQPLIHWTLHCSSDTCQSTLAADLYAVTRAVEREDDPLYEKCHGCCDNNEVGRVEDDDGERVLLAATRLRVCLCHVGLAVCHCGFLLNDTSAVIAVLGDHYPTRVCGSDVQMCVWS